MPRTIPTLLAVMLLVGCEKEAADVTQPLTDPIEIVKAGYFPGMEDKTIGEVLDVGEEFEVKWRTWN